MEKLEIFRFLIYGIIICLLIGTIYVTLENYKARQEIMDTVDICKAIEDQDSGEISRICKIDIIYNLSHPTRPYSSGPINITNYQ